MVNFGPLATEIDSLVWGTPGNFNGFRVLAALLHGTLVVGVSQTAAFNRGHHLYSAGRPSRWALAHISSSLLFFFLSFSFMAALCNRASHYIFLRSFLSSSFFFFPRLMSVVVCCCVLTSATRKNKKSCSARCVGTIKSRETRCLLPDEQSRRCGACGARNRRRMDSVACVRRR